MIKNSSSSLKNLPKLNMPTEHPSTRRQNYHDHIYYVNQGQANKRSIKSILLKSSGQNQRQQKQRLRIIKHSQPSIAISKISRKTQNKKGLNMISKKKYHKLSSTCLNLEKHSRVSIKGNQSQDVQSVMEKSWKSYFSYKPNYNSTQLIATKKSSKIGNDKFLHVLTHMKEKKKQNKRYPTKEMEVTFGQQVQIQKENKISVKGKLMNRSLRDTDSAEFYNQKISKHVNMNQRMCTYDKVQDQLKPKINQQTKVTFTNQIASQKIGQKRLGHINPQFQIRINHVNSNFQGSKIIRFSNFDADNEHSKNSTTNKMCSTQVSNEDGLQNRSISPDSKIRINQFFLKNFDMPVRVSTIYEEQSMDQNQKTSRQLLLQNFDSFSPLKKKQKLDSQKRLLWKSKGPSIDVMHKQISPQKALTPAKELQDQKYNQQEEYMTDKKQEYKFKILRNRIIDSLNDVRTVETKVNENSSVSSSNQKIEESIIIFKGSSDIELNQKLAGQLSASPYKKKLAMRLSYSNEKEANHFDSQFDRYQESSSRLSFLKFRKQNKITQQQNEDQIFGSRQEGKSQKLQKDLSFQLKNIEQIESSDQQYVSTVLKQIQKGTINYRNLKQVYEQLSYILEKQYNRRQKFIKPQYQSNRVGHRILEGFLVINGIYQFKYSDSFTGVCLQQLNGILMMELCSQIQRQIPFNFFK